MSPNALPIWRDIDADEAEARLSNLRRRQAEVEIALSHQRQIQKFHPESFAVSLSRKSIEAKRDQLSAELATVMRHRVNEPVNVSLDGSEFHDHSAGAGTLGVFLIRLQKLYSAVAQAIHTGPTLRGPIAGALREATELRFAQVFPSSFGMELYVPSKLDLMGRSIASDSLEALFGLLSASGDEKKLMQVSGELGGRAVNHLRHLVSSVASSGSSILIEWADYTGTKHSWGASQEAAQAVVSHLKNIIQTRSSERVVTGLLGGGSLFKNQFELLITEENTLIEGNMVAGLGEAMKQFFGTVCTVTVDETEVLDRGSGERRTYYVLTAIGGVSNEELTLPSG